LAWSPPGNGHSDVLVHASIGNLGTTTRPAATAGLPCQWTERTLDGDPRDGHAAPPAPAGSALGTPRLAATLAVVADPLADGVRLAGVLGTTCTVLDDRLEAPAASVGLGDGSLVLTAVGDAGAWGAAPSRPKAQGLAFEVPDVDLATAAAEGRGLHVVGRHLLGPVLAGGALPCPVAFTEALPVGDPRAGARAAELGRPRRQPRTRRPGRAPVSTPHRRVTSPATIVAS
jgi:hypothetical protein